MDTWIWTTLPTMKVFLTILVVCALYQTQAQQFSDDDLEFVKLVHRSFCGTQSLCTLPNKVLAGNSTTTTTTTRVLSSLPVTTPEFIDTACCEACSCNVSTCFESGNCCPDILDRLPTVQESNQPKLMVCQNTSVRAVGSFQTLWAYSLCSEEFSVENNQTAADIKSKCENREKYFDLDARLPVIDPVRQRVYANKFCALCGFVPETVLIPLTTVLQCYEGEQFSQNVNLDTLIQDVLKTKYCDIEFHWPYTRVNFSVPICRQVDTQCNTTGLWNQYDPLIDAACRAYRAHYNFVYNNIFCYLCNEVTTMGECTSTGGRAVGAVSFAAVLDFSRGTKSIPEPLTQCSSKEVYDHYKDVCRELICIFPRILQGGQCVNVGDSVTEVAYKLQVMFQPIGVYADHKIEVIVPIIMDYISTLLTSWGSLDAVYKYEFFYKFAFAVVESPGSGDIKTTNSVTSPSTTLPNKSLEKGLNNASDSTTTPPDGFMEPRRRKRQADDNTTPSTDLPPPPLPNLGNLPDTGSPTGPPISVVLAVSYILWQVEWYFTPRVSGYHSKDFLDNVLKLDESNITLNDPADGMSISFNLFITDYESGQFGFNPVDPVNNIPLPQFPVTVELPNAVLLQPVYAPIQSVKQTLVCPLITIDTSEFNITKRSGEIFVEEFNFTFDSKIYKKELGDQNKSIYSICKEAYLSVTERYIQNKTIDTMPESGITPQGVLSVVCACISILCSICTLITYLLFRELRTQPGINNVFLCVYLICAQVFFTFATPQEDSVSEWACSLIGALTHFFWLMVVFAMNVCCYHMVMVFIGQSPNRTKPASLLVKSVLYTVYCVISSLLFVAINIIVVFVDTDKEQTGYGDGLCYISRPEMVGYVFALPLGLVLLINIVFFVTVVVKISRTPTVNSKSKKDRNYFKIYAKLSSITGLTWIFGFLFQFTGQVVFEYIFIILNGGIGVLIFLSFVFNMRIYKLYKELFIGKVSKDTYGMPSRTQETTLSSASQSTTET